MTDLRKQGLVLAIGLVVIFIQTAIPEWLLSSGSAYENLNSRERFSKELTILLEWLTLSKKELRLRKIIEEELQSVINASIPNGKLGIVGSSYTGLYGT